MAERNTALSDEQLTTQFSMDHVRRLGQYLLPYRGAIIKVLVSILVANLAVMVGPVVTQQAIDIYIPNSDTSGILVAGGIFLLAILIGAWCMRYRIYHMSEIGQYVLMDIRRDLFVHLQRLPFSFFDSRPHGKILTRVVNYINTLSDLLSNGVITLISDIFKLVITLVFMIAMDARLTLYSLALIPILVGLVLLIQRLQRKAYQHLSNKQSNLNAYIHESIAGVRITQSFAREHYNREIFADASDEYRSAWMTSYYYQALMWPTVMIISTLSTSLIYFVGIRQIGVAVSTGTLIAFISFVNNFWEPIINIGNFYNNLITASVYVERIFEVMDEVPEVEDAPDAYTLPPIKGQVEFDQVTFRYEKNGCDILKNVNFQVEPGRTIALVGPTGAGKTTIVNLLSRFYNVSEGAVLIDGHDISQVTLRSLRKQMGIMLQDTFIFSGTIMENLRYGNLNATDEEVKLACRIVQADRFIEKLPDGYNTVVEERGSSLSAGQRQLIAFARTLLNDPQILVLDEATSSIDTETEAILQEGLQRLLVGRTSFIIAHRLSTIKNSDEIFYIEAGEIVERGSHDELMAERGLYYQLYQSQYEMSGE